MKHITLALGLVALTGCSGFNVFKDNNTASNMPPPEPTLAPAPGTQSMPGVMSGEQIKKLLSGKSWKWAKAQRTAA
ncbi:MAG: hypothetical protein U1E15_12185 [Hyphomicrobiales bacterium]